MQVLAEVFAVLATAVTARQQKLSDVERLRLLGVLETTLRHCKGQLLLPYTVSGSNSSAWAQQLAQRAAGLIAELLVDGVDGQQPDAEAAGDALIVLQLLVGTGAFQMLAAAVRGPAIAAAQRVDSLQQAPADGAAASPAAMQLRPGGLPARAPQQQQPGHANPVRRMAQALQLFVQRAAMLQEAAPLPPAVHVAAVCAATSMLSAALQLAVAAAGESSATAFAAHAEAVIRCQVVCQLIQQVGC